MTSVLNNNDSAAGSLRTALSTVSNATATFTTSIGITLTTGQIEIVGNDVIALGGRSVTVKGAADNSAPIFSAVSAATIELQNGTLNLFGNDTTMTSSGVFIVDSGATLTGAVSGMDASSITDAGAVIFAATTAGTHLLGAAITGAGSIQQTGIDLALLTGNLSGFTGTISIAGADSLGISFVGSETVSAALTGAGTFVKGATTANTGVLALTGNLAGFAGTFLVNAGTLDVSHAVGGNDIINGGTARTQIFGGTGNDIITLGTGGGLVLGGTGTATINGGTTGTGFGDVNAAIVIGASHGGLITAGGNGSIVQGGGGSETIVAGAGLSVSGGAQLLIGALTDSQAIDVIRSSGVAGSTDYVFAGVGSTAITSSGSETLVVQGNSGTLTVTAGNGPLLLSAASKIGVTGSAVPLTTVIEGNASSAFILDPTITGAASALSITGGAGTLSVLGSAGNTAGMTVQGAAGAALIIADAGNDRITLGIGAGTVYGGVGLDTIVAGAGAATSVLIDGANLRGPSAAADSFKILTGTGPVEIVGFRKGIDHLDLTSFGITTSSSAGFTSSQVSTSVPGLGTLAALDVVFATSTQHVQLIGITTLTASDLTSVSV